MTRISVPQDHAKLSAALNSVYTSACHRSKGPRFRGFLYLMQHASSPKLSKGLRQDSGKGPNPRPSSAQSSADDVS